MRANDALTVTGELLVELIGPDGKIKERHHYKNLVVTAGKNLIADRMKAAPAKGALSHMAVGTNSTAPAAGDTTLGVESARVALTSTTVTNNQIAYVGNFPAGTGTATLAEAALFNANAAGDMLCRALIGPVTKAAADALTITWTVTIN